MLIILILLFPSVHCGVWLSGPVMVADGMVDTARSCPERTWLTTDIGEIIVVIMGRELTLSCSMGTINPRCPGNKTSQEDASISLITAIR